MANFYLQFSAEVEDLTQNEHAWLEAQLYLLFGVRECEEGSDGHNALLDIVSLYKLDDIDEPIGFDSSFADGNLQIYAEEGGNIEHVGIFIQRFLRRFRKNGAFMMSYATTCNQMRLNGFGGGAIFVTAEKIECMDGWEWGTGKLKEFRNGID